MDERTSNAVRECIAYCEDWNNPLPDINDFVGRLAKQGWDLADARIVGHKALQILDPQHPLLKNGNGQDGH